MRICSSTVGPHICASHRRGVENETTVGLPFRSASSREM
jgi:hypothetical protein